ncbi:MAG: mechanosensitive ion channel, partial [Merismopedia sp. SIO2A8]|nr:mechanosensitive ion channel [Merismopedia sp. SIO2A8]
MSGLLETIITSLQELVGSGIKILPGLLTALIIILLTRYAAEFVQQIADKLGTKTIKSYSLQLLLSKTAYVSAWVIGALFAAVVAFPGLELGDIIATLGLSSVAVGFAFQDIFKNFLAGVLLLLQEPFRINDQVIIGDYEGTVERIDIRTTQIRTYTGEQVILPNATVFTSAVQVRTAFESRLRSPSVEAPRTRRRRGAVLGRPGRWLSGTVTRP